MLEYYIVYQLIRHGIYQACVYYVHVTYIVLIIITLINYTRDYCYDNLDLLCMPMKFIFLL